MQLRQALSLDPDDLHFFHLLGIGLRHTEADLAHKQTAEGANKGDAVSLANFGLNGRESCLYATGDHCEALQRAIEKFIKGCLNGFHNPKDHYKRAAFILMIRGDDARNPYDFDSYPLGKCGTQAFEKQQCLTWITSENHSNNNLDHAAVNSFQALMNAIKAAKIKFTRDLMQRFVDAKMPLEVSQCKSIIELYEADIYINVPLVALLTKTAHKLGLYDQDFISKFFDDVKVKYHYHEESQITVMISSVDRTVTKVNQALSFSYQPFNYQNATLVEKIDYLIKSINHYNYEEIIACLMQLEQSESGAREMMRNKQVLSEAANRDHFETFKAIYEFDPGAYELLPKHEATPIFLAAKHANLKTLEYLVARHPILPADILHGNAHILKSPCLTRNDNAKNVIKFLLGKIPDIGDELESGFENPLALICGLPDENTLSTLEMVIPYAKAGSKYAAIVRCTTEIYYLNDCYNRTERTPGESDKESIEPYLAARRRILASLTDEECLSIKNIFSSHQNAGRLITGESILIDELQNHEAYVLDEQTPLIKDRINLCFPISLTNHHIFKSNAASSSLDARFTASGVSSFTKAT